MKNLKMFLFLAFLSAGVLTIGACGGSDSHKGDDMEHSDGAEHADDKGKEYTSDYVCPMHCEGSGSDKAGTCPKCGMTYVENTEKSDDDPGDHDH
jgi:heavy metal-binding protein